MQKEEEAASVAPLGAASPQQKAPLSRTAQARYLRELLVVLGKQMEDRMVDGGPVWGDVGLPCREKQNLKGLGRMGRDGIPETQRNGEWRYGAYVAITRPSEPGSRL